MNEGGKWIGQGLMVVALTGDQKENPPWDHLLCSADTLLEQNLPLLSTASPTLA